MPVPMRRTAVRVLPVNREGEVLRLFGCDRQRPDAPYWFTIGGATEQGESLAEAGVREMREETGIVVRRDDLVGPYRRAFHEFDWNGWRLANDSHFFAVRVDDVVVSFDGLEPLEVGTTLDSGWWSPERMPAQLSNPDLPEVARLAVAAVGL